MAYTGRAPSAAPLTSGDITDGAVAPVDLSTGAPSWDTSGNLTVDGGAVFNEAGADVDFRVESDTNTHALFLEGSSGNVGIGTSSPSAQLHVQNSSGNSTSILGQFGTGTRAEVTAASNEVVFKAYNGTNDVMTFYTGASERMRIDSSGNVGIGTSSPSAKLHVRDFLRVSTSATGDGSTDGTILSVGASGEAYLYNYEAQPLIFATNATERMRIDSSGNLKFNSGYGSVATAYGCRAWVNFNGTGTVAIRASGNVSSITDRGQGIYTVNFSSSFPDIDYVFTGYCNEGDGYSGDIVAIDGGRAARSVSACPVRLWEISNTNPYDSFEYMCQFVR